MHTHTVLWILVDSVSEYRLPLRSCTRCASAVVGNTTTCLLVHVSYCSDQSCRNFVQGCCGVMRVGIPGADKAVINCYKLGRRPHIVRRSNASLLLLETPDVVSASLILLLWFDSISEPLSQRTHLSPRRRPPQKSKPFSAGRQDAKQRAPLVAHAPRCTVAQKLCRSRHQRMQSDGRKRRISAAARMATANQNGGRLR